MFCKKSLAALAAFLPLFSTTVVQAQQGKTLIGDLSLDKIYLTQDIDGDGQALTVNETTVYFDENNASGLESPTNSVFNLYRGRDGFVYIADGGSDAVYRLDDKNKDGDAQDEGEAAVWFSEANAAGFTLPTPNGVYQDRDDAVYIVNAGVSSRPQDAVYRTVDLNGDGDANDEGEATLWLDLSTLATSVIGSETENVSSAFQITFFKDAAYIVDTVGGEADTLFKAEDMNGDNVIDESELVVFLDAENTFGAPVCIAVVTDTQSLYVNECSRATDVTQRIYKLNDLNDSGTIDSAEEAVEIWNESVIDETLPLGLAWGMDITRNGVIYLTSAFGDESDNVWRLSDNNANGSYMDEGETVLWSSNTLGDGVFPNFARTAEFLPDYFSMGGYHGVTDISAYTGRIEDVTTIVALLDAETIDWDAIENIFLEGGAESTVPSLSEWLLSLDRARTGNQVLQRTVLAVIRGDDSVASGHLKPFSDFSEANRARILKQGLIGVQNRLMRYYLTLSKRVQFDNSCEGAPLFWDIAAALYFGDHLQNSPYSFARAQEDFRLQKRSTRFLTRGIDILVDANEKTQRQWNKARDCRVVNRVKFPISIYTLLLKNMNDTFNTYKLSLLAPRQAAWLARFEDENALEEHDILSWLIRITQYGK